MTNPILSHCKGFQGSLRDPSVLFHGPEGGYTIFYTQVVGDEYYDPANWSVRAVHTMDFKHYTNDRAMTGHGFASPSEVIAFGGRWLWACQSYPGPSKLFYFRFTKVIWMTCSLLHAAL